VEGAGGEAGGERPLDGGGLAGVSGVEPVDVPVLLDGEDEADYLRAAGGDCRAEFDQFRGEVLRFDRAGAAIAESSSPASTSADNRRPPRPVRPIPLPPEVMGHAFH